MSIYNWPDQVSDEILVVAIFADLTLIGALGSGTMHPDHPE